MFCYVIISVLLSSFAIILIGKGVLVALFLISCLMSCNCNCSVTIPRGALGLPAVCECGISLSYTLTYFYNTVANIIHQMLTTYWTTSIPSSPI